MQLKLFRSGEYMKNPGFIVLLLSLSTPALADDLDCISTTFRLLTPNDKVCVSAFEDENVGGVTCYIGQARTGGISGGLGLAEDPSRFSLSCVQTGPVTADLAALDKREKVYSDKTSIFFKHTKIFRLVDMKRRALIYVAISDKIVEGSPYNAVSSVAIRPWPAD